MNVNYLDDLRGGNLQPSPAVAGSKPRVDYVDLLKGITILWIIWIHTDHPDFGNYRNPIFFFASGIFFKITDIRTFLSKRLFSILIPFLFFYILSIPFRFVVDLWDTRSLTAFDWGRIWDLFAVEAQSDYLSLNVPLWFLLTLFIIQALSLVACRLDRRMLAGLAVLSLVFEHELSAWPTLFMFNNALGWFGYFAIGYLAGKPLIAFMSTRTRRLTVFVAALSLMGLCLLMEWQGVPDWRNMINKVKVLSFIIAFMTMFSFFNGVKSLDFLRFFGKNSLIVLGAHLWILVPIERMMFKVLRFHHPWVGFGMAVATAALLIPLIIWMNRHIPLLVGKRNG